MKNNFIKIFCTSCCLIFCLGLNAQKDIIKAHLFAIPGQLKVFTIGIGYERMLTSNKSVQVLYNRYGYDMRDSDGNSETINSIIPEYRIYFGKQLNNNFNKSAFFGIFNEFSISKLKPSGNDLGSKILIEKNKVIISPGNAKIIDSESELLLFRLFFT